MELVLTVLVSLIPIAFSLIFLAIIAFWIWMLVDCLNNESSQGNDKTVWTLTNIFASILGAALYFIIRRPERIRQASSNMI